MAGAMLFLLGSCLKEENRVIFDASKCTPPTLNEYEVVDGTVSVKYTPATLNINEKIAYHMLALVSLDGQAVSKSLTTADKGGVLSVSSSNLARTLISMGCEEGSVHSIRMVIRASSLKTPEDDAPQSFVESLAAVEIAEYEVILPGGDPYARYTEKSEWGLVGSFNGWGTDPDVEMWTNGTLHVVKGVTLEAGTEVKFRKDSKWDENLGYAEGVDSYTLGEEFALAPGGPNIVIAETGRYDMIVDVEGKTCKIIDSVASQEDPYADYTEVSPWSVIGSFNSWGGDVEMVTNGTLHVCKNITFTAGTEFKFRKDAKWDENYGYAEGVDSYTLGEEFAVGQGGANIVIAEDGAYDLFLDPASATAKIIKTQAVTIDPYAAYTETSPWSVIGSFNNWGGDVEMVTNGTLHVAKAIAFNAGTQWKFRKDADWAVNFGYAEGVDSYTLGEEFAMGQDGANIIIAEDGVYDLILDPENATGKIIASVAVDQPEPPAPEEKPGMWSLIGTLNGTNWDTDFDMSNTSGDVWIIRSVKVTASDEFKIRADHEWGKSVGGPEENSTSTIDPTNPYGVYKPELGKAFEAKDKNIQIGKDGLFDVTYDYAAQTILVEEHVAVYSLIGMINGTEWNTDFAMKEKNGVWTSEVVKINGGFKIRYDYSWADENTYGAESGFEPQLGVPFTATQPGSDITLAEGSYKVQFTPATKEVVITAIAFPEHLYMIGAEFGGWDWSSDGVVDMVPVVYQPDWGDGCNKSEAQFWTVRYFTANQGFKFNSAKAWNGTDFWGLDTNEGFVESGGNCTVTEDGFYLVHVDLKRSIVHVEPARVYGIGPCFGGYNTAMEDALFKADGKTLKATTTGGGELRMYVESAIANSDWWTREFIFFEDGIIDYRGDDEGQGDQQRVKVMQGQEIILDFNAGKGEVKGEGTESDAPKVWSLIGTLNDTSWDTDFDLENVSGSTWVIKDVTLTAEDKFKIRADHDWTISVGGPEDNNGGTYKPEIGKAFAAGEKDICVGVAGQFTITLDYGKEPTILIEEYKAYPDHLYMIGADFGGWDWGSDGVVEMIPVLHNPDWGANAEGQFWTVRYFTANQGFKFNSAKAWNGTDFWGLTTNEGFVEAGGNCTVTEDGVYLVHIDLKNGIVHVEPARIMGKGDCFGGWDVAATPFTVEGNKVKGTTTTAGKLRMYVESDIATSDWWTREFLFYDGVISYRGGGGDLEDVIVEAGKTVTLDFNAGTATLE